MRIGDFPEVHLAVHRVGMMLTHVIGPSAGTARPAGTAQRDGILTRKQADPLQTGAGNDALRKDVVVFMDDTPQVHDKLFRLPHEIGMQVGLHATNHIVVLNQPSSGGILENVENHLTLPEAIEKRCQRSHVHGQAGIKQ